MALAVLLCAAAALSLARIPSSAAARAAPVTRVVFPESVRQRALARLTAVVSKKGTADAVPNAIARVYWYDGGRYYFVGAAPVDGAGRVALDGLPLGPAWLLVDAPGYARRSAPVALERDGAAVAVPLEPARTLRFHVEDDAHAPVDSATVLVTGNDPLPFGALTDRAGNASFERLGEGPFAVRALARGYEEESRQGVAADTTLVLRRASGIDVTVMDVAGAKVALATVFIAGSGLWPARSVTTGPDGTVRIPGLAAGAYDLKAQNGALVSRTEIGVKVERGQIRAVTLTVLPGRIVPILVTDGEGDHPIVVPDADVLLVEGGVSSFPLQGRTDRFGRVTLGPVAPGSVMATARAEGFVSRATVAVPEETKEDVRIPLLRGATLKGVVVDAGDRGVEGATIEVVGTDVDGMPVALTPMSSEFQRAHFEWALSGPLPLIPAGELGVLPGPIPPIPNGPGEPLASRPSLPSLSQELSREAWVTSRTGSFRASPVPPGRVRVLVRHPEFVEGASEMVTTAPGGTAEVRIVLRAGGAIAGRVVDERGNWIAKARVRATAVQGTLDRTATSAGDGTFTFSALPADVMLGLSRPEDPFREVLRVRAHVTEGKETDVTLTLPAPREALVVSISDDANKPVPSAQVSALSLDPERPLRATEFTGDEGLVTFTDAAGLPLRIVIDAPGFARFTRQVDSAGVHLSVVLAASVIIEGRVTAVRGRSDVNGATVELAAQGSRRVALTDALGRYRFMDVTPGKVHLTVSHPDYAPAETDLAVVPTGRADRPFDAPVIDLEEAGAIAGRVVDAAGNGVMGARVGTGILPAFVPVGALVPGSVTTSQDGSFRLDRVRPGKVDVEAFAAGLGRARRTGVDVAPGRVAEGLTLQLVPAEDQVDPAATGGVAVTLSDAQGGGGVAVLQIAQGSEAERGGLVPGDVIVSIDRAEAASATDAVRRLAGPDGSDVVVEVQRGAERTTLRIRRERVRR